MLATKESADIIKELVDSAGPNKAGNHAIKSTGNNNGAMEYQLLS